MDYTPSPPPRRSAHEGERALFLRLRPDTYSWLENRAAANGRARMREAEIILEESRAREARRQTRGTLHAQGGAA